MKEYTIQKANGKTVDCETLPKAEIDTFKWMDNGYRPKTFARLCYDAEAIYVRFWSYETEIRAEHKKHERGICKDSCVEFFFRPASDMRYLNIETNVIGSMLIGLGEGRPDREDIVVSTIDLQISPSVQDAENYKDDVWSVSYQIPFSFLRRVYGDVDFIKEGLYGNLYKCGDFTRYRHYGMWNPVGQDTPEFHLSQYFGKFNFA